MSPGSRSASAMSRMTRARPSTVPAETGRPTSAPAGTSSRRYAPAMPSPSDVSTRGGVSARYDSNASLRSRMSWSIHLVRAHDILELLEPEEEDVFLLTKDVGLHEAFGFFQQGLLVDEVAADHAVLRILPVPDEGPDPVDHPLGLFGLPLTVRQGTQPLQHLLFLRPRLLPPLLEAPLAGARLEVLDVAEDHGHELGGAFAPARPRDVDLADAAHAVRVEPAPDGVAGFRTALERGQLVDEALVILDVLQEGHHLRDAGGSRPRRPGAPAPSPM